jgi:uncharacterized protein
LSSSVSIFPGMEAHASGALSIPASKTVIIADLHLGYSWAQRRRGELGPLADSRTREKLFRVLNELGSERIVFLGDVVHAPRPCQPEREWIEQTLTELSHRAELIAVRGNHDRAFAKEFAHLPVRMAESWSEENVFALHGDRLPQNIEQGQTLVVGHLHPSIPVKDSAGAGQRLAVFLATNRCIVMPAFSPFARGYDLTAGVPAELASHFGDGEIHAYAASGTRVVQLGPLQRALNRMFEADVSAPALFRRGR